MTNSIQNEYAKERNVLAISLCMPLLAAACLAGLLIGKGKVELSIFQEVSVIMACSGFIIGIIFGNRLVLTQMQKVITIRERNNQVLRINTALDNGDIKPYFQSRVSQTSGKITGCEALARWECQGCVIPPAEFIPFSIKEGLISEIDTEIAVQAIEQLKVWLITNKITDDFTLSFNVAADTLQCTDSIKKIANALSTVVNERISIEIEITEQTKIETNDMMLRNIELLKQSGADLALDDFTAGHNSMTMLTTIKFDTIKFDRSLITFKVNDTRSQEISIKVLENFVILSKQLGLNTTLEGIETPEALQLYQSSGIESFQGFLFSKPLSSNDFEQHYTNFNH
ncbi:EAL domain-containing protein [Vibrio sp. 10N.222.51.C8]|uniref:EAL domain-containing protein n=2 Tax=Vibrio cyclitrophicus TaxID=47951 RepID=A0ACD5G390_9VIBR|nr:EAL domain-containing protein [Vibrio cyclitrophicus]